MKKLLLILLCMITLTGCQDNTSSPTKPNKKEETPIVEQKKETLDDVTFELYDEFSRDVNVYENFNSESIDILVDRRNDKVYNLQTRELITNKDFLNKVPRGIVFSFMLVSSACGGGKGLAYNTGMGSPVGSHTLADRVCRAEISQDLINRINSLDGFKVWGVSIPFNLSMYDEQERNRMLEYQEYDPTNIVSIEIPMGFHSSSTEELREEMIKLKKQLHSKFGLINPTNLGPQGYDSIRLSIRSCDKYNLKCEVVD